MNRFPENPRILAVSLSARGFGYALMEGDAIISYGNKVIPGDKNPKVLEQIERMIAKYRPVDLVRQDVSAMGTHRGRRTKALDRDLESLAQASGLGTCAISGPELRRMLLGDEKGTKHQMAERIAKQFPKDLGPRLPKKRKAWHSEDARMDIFGAVGLALVYRYKQKYTGAFTKPIEPPRPAANSVY